MTTGFKIDFRAGSLDDDEDRVAILLNGKLVYASRIKHGEQVTLINESDGCTVREDVR